jgi:hypothetical protein
MHPMTKASLANACRAQRHGDGFRVAQPILRAIAVLLLAEGLALSAEGNGANRELLNSKQAESVADCSSRLMAFVREIDEQMESSHSIEPLELTLGRYFPLFGCNLDEAVSITRSSKYFYSADRMGSDRLGSLVIVLRKRIPNGWGFKVSFGLRLSSGDSVLPAAMVDKTK